MAAAAGTEELLGPAVPDGLPQRRQDPTGSDGLAGERQHRGRIRVVVPEGEQEEFVERPRRRDPDAHEAGEHARAERLVGLHVQGEPNQAGNGLLVALPGERDEGRVPAPKPITSSAARRRRIAFRLSSRRAASQAPTALRLSSSKQGPFHGAAGLAGRLDDRGEKRRAVPCAAGSPSGVRSTRVQALALGLDSNTWRARSTSLRGTRRSG